MFDKEEIFFGADCEIRSFLCDELKSIPITLLPCTDSTNEDMKKSARNGAEEFSLIVADRQQKGKGRLGRSFFSPEGTGLYMSLLLKPDCTVEQSTLLTTLAATAAAEAIEEVTGIRADIKWVNDIFIDGKKVAGILTEGSVSADKTRPEWAVIGIGINISPPEKGFPDEIRDIAGYLLPKGDFNLRNRLVAATVNRIFDYYSHFSRKAFIDCYRKRLFFLGEKVTLIRDGKETEVTAVDIDDMCRLCVIHPDGSGESVYGGEISIRPCLRE